MSKAKAKLEQRINGEELFRAVLGRKFTDYMETDFARTVRELRHMEDIGDSDVGAIGYHLQNGRELEFTIEDVVDEDVCSGNVIRSLGNLYRIVWSMPGLKKQIASFVNVYASPEKYRAAFNAQSFFHYAVMLAGEKSKGEHSFPHLQVMRPSSDPNETLLSNTFVNGRTLNQVLDEDNAYDHLSVLMREVKALGEFAYAHQQEIYARMRKEGFKVPRKGYFQELNYTRQFVEKALLRLDRELAQDLKNLGIVSPQGRVVNDRRFDAYVKMHPELDDLLHHVDNVTTECRQNVNAISNTDIMPRNVIVKKTKDGFVYTIIDFEWSWIDNIVGVLTPLMFRAEHYGIDRRIATELGLDTELVEIQKIRQHFMWAGVYAENASYSTVTNPEAARDFSRYRFGKGMEGLLKNGWYAAEKAFKNYFGEYWMPYLEAAQFEARNHPLKASISFMKVADERSNAASQIVHKRAKRSQRLKWAQNIAIVAMLAAGAIYCYNKWNQKEGNTYFARWEANRFQDYYQGAFEDQKTYMIDGKITNRLEISSAYIERRVKEHGLGDEDVRVIRNLMEVNRVFGGVKNGLEGKEVLGGISLFDMYFAIDGNIEQRKYDPIENFELGLDRYAALKREYNLKDTLTRFIFPWDKGMCPGGSISRDALPFLEENVRRLVYNAMNGSLNEGDEAYSKVHTETSLKHPPSDFKIDFSYVIQGLRR